MPRSTSALPSVRELSIELIGSRAEVRRRGGIIPSWVLLGMVMLATVSVCVTVTIRTHGEMQTAASNFSRMREQVNILQRGNSALQTEIKRLNSDPKAIEAAARTQLNMARANEIVVPVE
jgi:cell division protein FtsB